MDCFVIRKRKIDDSDSNDVSREKFFGIGDPPSQISATALLKSSSQINIANAASTSISENSPSSDIGVYTGCAAALHNNDSITSVTIAQNYAALYTYLRYLYTDEFLVDMNVAIDALSLSYEYNDVDFQIRCENSIQRRLGIDNIVGVFVIALKLSSKKLLKSCRLFVISHLSAIVLSPNFLNLDPETMKSVLLQCSQKNG